MVTTSTPAFHALLIGIDAYPTSQLSGCVNDIDAVQHVLLDRMGVPVAQIRRLAAPLPNTSPSNRVPATLPTLGNIQDALAYLGSDKIASDDRVFIYYSGHGARVPVTDAGRTYHREAMVPSDCDPVAGTGLLFDHELNGLLAAIARRTTSVSIVFDCCHAAGTYRGHMQPRYMKGAWVAPVLVTRGGAADQAPLGTVDSLSVVMACQASELAYEDTGPDRVCHGLFTKAFVDALAGATGNLHALPWSRIWETVKAAQLRRNSAQTPAIAGSLARAVFAGPPVTGDPGFAVTQDERGLVVQAGLLADVTKHTQLAVYGELPLELPRLGSDEELRARIGTLMIVDEPTLATAPAKAELPFTLPAGARARIVRRGGPAPITYALVPDHPGVATELAKSPLLRAVPAHEAMVKLVNDGDRWFLVDARHGVAEPYPVLFELRSGELDCARALLEHYYLYSRPLRMAKQIGDLPNRFVLRVLRCAEVLTPAQAQLATSLSEATQADDGAYQLEANARVCLRVDNLSSKLMRVTLVNVAASGKVQMLGDEIVDGFSSHVFWAGSQLGAAFEMVPPRGKAHCLDRMVAVGRTALAHDLGYLLVDRSFEQVIARTRDAAGPQGKDLTSPPPIDHWVTAQAVLETRRT